MQRFRHYALLAVATLTTSVGGARVERLKKQNRANGISSASRSLWTKYVARVTAQADKVAGGFQQECQPGLHEHQGEYRGVALLFHGYTACNQQYKLLAPLLTAKGFTVLLPVSPGHGYRWKSNPGGSFDPEDNIDDMPTDGDVYREFGREMHSIVQASSGEKVVFGLSLGGGLAAFTAGLGGFDRRFLVAPMILIKGLGNLGASVVGNVPFRRGARRSWGEECEVQRKHGRAGICQFTALHGLAARSVGRKYSEKSNDTVYYPGQAQIVMVEDDPAVANGAIIDMAERKFGMTPASPNICILDKEQGHSMLSTYDNVGVDMYWLPELNKMIVDYLADGYLVPQGGGTKAFGMRNWPRCDTMAPP